MTAMIKTVDRIDLSHLSDEQRLEEFKLRGVEPRDDYTNKTLILVFEDNIKIAIAPKLSKADD